MRTLVPVDRDCCRTRGCAKIAAAVLASLCELWKEGSACNFAVGNSQSHMSYDGKVIYIHLMCFLYIITSLPFLVLGLRLYIALLHVHSISLCGYAEAWSDDPRMSLDAHIYISYKYNIINNTLVVYLE